MDHVGVLPFSVCSESDPELRRNIPVFVKNEHYESSENRERRDGMMTLRERAKKLKSDIPAVYLALRDPETPAAARLLAGITIAYALSPIDLIPDFIPVLGYLDDIILLPAMAAATIKLIPDSVWTRCRENAADLWKDGKPKKWYYAIPIAAFWLLVLFCIIKAFFH